MKFKVMATSVDYAEDLVEKYPQLRKYGHELVIDKEAFFKRHMNPIAKEFEKEIFNFVDDNYRDTVVINNDKPKHCEDITQTVIEKYCDDDEYYNYIHINNLDELKKLIRDVNHEIIMFDDTIIISDSDKGK